MYRATESQREELLKSVLNLNFVFLLWQTLRLQIQESHGCLKIRKNVANPKICISRSTIHPRCSKSKNHYEKTLTTEEKKIKILMVNFWPAKDHFWIKKLFFWPFLKWIFTYSFMFLKFYSILGRWSTWKYISFNFSYPFQSFATPGTTGSASAVVWNRFKWFLPQCEFSSELGLIYESKVF